MGKKKSKKDMTFSERVLENIRVFFSAYVIVFFIRLFLIEAYQIPSQSMVPNLLVRDILMVEKVTMGTKIPVLKWKFPGLLKPKRNDIIVFVSPAWQSPGISKELISLLTFSLINLDNTFETPKNLVKRLVALPGDRVFMSNHILYINGEKVEAESVAIVKQPILDRFKKVGTEDFHVFKEKYMGKSRLVQYVVDVDRIEQINYFNSFANLTNDSVVDKFDIYRAFLMNNFPEIYVPKKGDRIKISSANGYYKYLLRLLIERESGKKVNVERGKFFVDGKEIDEWLVKDNYYFAMGDNRHLSEDCRYFGFIPESNIFGKPFIRYFPLLRIGFDFNEKPENIIKRYL
ncbi:MAG: signal peptidase I [Brevinematia bacterium]